MKLHIALEKHPSGRDRETIEQGLTDHAVQSGIEPRNYRDLTVLLRDERGTIFGGLAGATVWGWLHIKQLWVADTLRRSGYGSELLRVAEEEAVQRGCEHALLDTFDFQAPSFYQRLGYVLFGTLEDFPRGHTRFFLQKNLRRER